MRVLRLSVPILALGLSLFGGASADADVITADEAPPHITFTDGQVWLDREGESHPAAIGLPFLPGDRLRSTVGRTEILFPDGTALHLDDGSSIELLSPSLLRLTSGRLRLIVAGPGGYGLVAPVQIDTPAASALIDGPGEYRLTLVDGPLGVEVELAVARGGATLSTDLGDTSMRAGERSVARYGEPPSRPYTFNAAAFDTFDLWSAARRDARTGQARFSTHLPRELQTYGGVLEREGNWHQETGYGYVWYPSVAVDWRPYSHGYWTDLPVYGWTWVGVSAWHWPTHHYGRWVHLRSRWFWVPGRTWRPAWVHWAVAPGYVGWSPWGFAHHRTLGLSFSIDHPGWVVVPRTSFGRRGPAHWDHARQGFPRESRFIVQDAPPVPHVARGTRVAATPARRVAVPRGSQPAASAAIVRFPDARRAPQPTGDVASSDSATSSIRRAQGRAAPQQDSRPPVARGPQGGWTSSRPASRARESAPPPDPGQGTPEPAPAAARPPRNAWTPPPPRATPRPVESAGRTYRGQRSPEAAAPAPAAAAQPPPAAAAGWSPRTQATPRRSRPAAREAPAAGQRAAARGSGDSSSAAGAPAQAGARGRAPAGGSQARGRARR